MQLEGDAQDHVAVRVALERAGAVGEAALLGRRSTVSRGRPVNGADRDRWCRSPPGRRRRRSGSASRRPSPGSRTSAFDAGEALGDRVGDELVPRLAGRDVQHARPAAAIAARERRGRPCRRTPSSATTTLDPPASSRTVARPSAPMQLRVGACLDEAAGGRRRAQASWSRTATRLGAYVVGRYPRRSCRRSSTSNRRSSCWSSSRRSTSATSSSRGGKQAKVWHPDLAPPGKQIEHERHLKAINEAADQLENLAEGSRGGRVSRNAVKASAAATRASRAEAGRRAYEEDQARRAHDADRAKQRPVRLARSRPLGRPPLRALPLLSGVGRRRGRGHLLHGRRRRRPAVGARALPARRAHGAGRLAAVRRLLQARPRRTSACSAS